VERLSVKEKWRIAELLAEGVPVWQLHQEINRSRFAIRRAVRSLLRPPAPQRQRSPLRLSLSEREEISRGLAAGDSLRHIAERLGRAPSTVSREVAANGGRRAYRACRADRAALRRARRPRASKLATCDRLRALVEAKLELRWSPQQISGWLAVTFPDEPEMRVSHETIYLSLFVQSRGALRKELTAYLRTRRSVRRPVGYAQSVRNGQGQIRGAVHISERPAEADDRAVPGHWEGDLLYGQGRGTVATLVERHSRFVMLVGLPTHHTADVVADAWPPRSPSYPTSSDGPSPGTKARRWPSTPASPWPAESPCTSATHAAHGSAAPTRTPTGSYANTSPATLASPTDHRPSSTPSPPSSTRRMLLSPPEPSGHYALGAPARVLNGRRRPAARRR
jgi:IS30 family transposase